MLGVISMLTPSILIMTQVSKGHTQKCRRNQLQVKNSLHLKYFLIDIILLFKWYTKAGHCILPQMDTMWVGHKTAYFVPGVVMLAPLISPIRFYDICIIFKRKKNYHHFSFKVWVSAPQLTNYKTTFSNQKEKLTFLLRCLKVLLRENTVSLVILQGLCGEQVKTEHTPEAQLLLDYR